MLKNMKLGAKIGSGFALLVLIAVALGSVAVWKMTTSEEDAKILAGEYVPSARIANDLERNMLQTVFEVRGYLITEDKAKFDVSMKYLGEARKALAEAKELGGTSARLADLAESAKAGEAKVAEYEKMLVETGAATEEMVKARGALDAAAADFNLNATAMLKGSCEELKGLLASGGDAATMQKRVESIALLNDIITVGNATFSTIWRAQIGRNVKAP